MKKTIFELAPFISGIVFTLSFYALDYAGINGLFFKNEFRFASLINDNFFMLFNAALIAQVAIWLLIAVVQNRIIKIDETTIWATELYRALSYSFILPAGFTFLFAESAFESGMFLFGAVLSALVSGFICFLWHRLSIGKEDFILIDKKLQNTEKSFSILLSRFWLYLISYIGAGICFVALYLLVTASLDFLNKNMNAIPVRSAVDFKFALILGSALALVGPTCSWLGRLITRFRVEENQFSWKHEFLNYGLGATLYAFGCWGWIVYNYEGYALWTLFLAIPMVLILIWITAGCFAFIGLKIHKY